MHKTLCFGGRFPERRRSRERLLRYPNGDTRLIRYPATDSEAEAEVEQETRTDAEKGQKAPVKTSELPSSPDALVRLIRSKAYVEAQKEHRKRIRESYRILERSPWETSRKVYVLAVRKMSAEAPRMYTLRTRLHRADVTNRLKTMFRGPGFEGEFIQVDNMMDGVITFLDLDNAERFKSLVEAEETQNVEVCETTSDELFVNTSLARAVVVAMNSTDYFPSLHELTTSLKSQDPTF